MADRDEGGAEAHRHMQHAIAHPPGPVGRNREEGDHEHIGDEVEGQPQASWKSLHEGRDMDVLTGSQGDRRPQERGENEQIPGQLFGPAQRAGDLPGEDLHGEQHEYENEDSRREGDESAVECSGGIRRSADRLPFCGPGSGVGARVLQRCGLVHGTLLPGRGMCPLLGSGRDAGWLQAALPRSIPTSRWPPPLELGQVRVRSYVPLGLEQFVDLVPDLRCEHGFIYGRDELHPLLLDHLVDQLGFPLFAQVRTPFYCLLGGRPDHLLGFLVLLAQEILVDGQEAHRGQVIRDGQVLLHFVEGERPELIGRPLGRAHDAGAQGYVQVVKRDRDRLRAELLEERDPSVDHRDAKLQPLEVLGRADGRLLRHKDPAAPVEGLEDLDPALVEHLLTHLVAERAVPESEIVVAVLHDVGSFAEEILRGVHVDEHGIRRRHLNRLQCHRLIDGFGIAHAPAGQHVDLDRPLGLPLDDLLELPGDLHDDALLVVGAGNFDLRTIIRRLFLRIGEPERAKHSGNDQHSDNKILSVHVDNLPS